MFGRLKGLGMMQKDGWERTMGMHTPALLANQGRAVPGKSVWPAEPSSFQKARLGLLDI